MTHKLKFALVGLLLFTFNLLGATDVVFSFADARLNVSTTTNRTVYIQRLSVPDGVNNTTVIIGPRLSYNTTNTGQFTVTNLQSGLYECTVKAPPEQTVFRILVTATNLGTIYAADILAAASTSTFPAGSVAWAASVTDGRYARASTSLSNYATTSYVASVFAQAQPTSSVLTAFATLSTNLFVNTNTFNTTTNTIYGWLGTAAFSNSSQFYPRTTNPSNFVDATITNVLSARLGTAAFSNASAFYLNSNPSNYITTSATNGFASQTYVQTLTNTLWSLLGTAALSNATNFYLDSNPSNYVTASVTNALNARLGTAALSNASAFYLNSNPSNYITTTATNGFASQTYVQTATNTLWGSLGTAARSNASAFYLDSNPSNYVTASVTNQLNSRLGTAAFSNASAFYLDSNPSNYITTAATNGLASQTYVQTLTNTLWSLLGTAARSNTSAFYLNSNPSNYVDSSITNVLNSRLGTAAFSNASAFLLASDTNRFLYTNNFKVLSALDVTSNTISAGHVLAWNGTSFTNGLPASSALVLNNYIPTTNGIATNALTVKGHLQVVTNTTTGSLLVTNAQTNLALTASRFIATDANKAFTSTATSAVLAGTLSDETGSGVAVFSSTPYITNAVLRGATIVDSTLSGYVYNDGVVVSGLGSIAILNGNNVALDCTEGNVFTISGNTTNGLIYGMRPQSDDNAQIITCVNSSATNHIFIHDSTDDPTNRIYTISGGNVTNRPGGVLQFVYDPNVDKWRPILNIEQ